MSFEIHKARVRAALRPRREPYWESPMGSYQHLGYRKIDSQRGAWIARRYDPDTSERKYKQVGTEPGTDYAQARQEAVRWFKERTAGICSDDATVEEVCREYVKDRKGGEKGDGWVHENELRFKAESATIPW